MGVYLDKFVVFADGRVGTIKKVSQKTKMVEVHVEREEIMRSISIEDIRHEQGIYVERTIGQTDTVRPDSKLEEGFDESVQDSRDKKESDEGGD